MYFLLFILLMRLSAGLATALQMHDDRFFLFTKNGNASRLPQGTWALSDSNETIARREEQLNPRFIMMFDIGDR